MIIAWIVLGFIVVLALATVAFELLGKLLEGATAFMAGVVATTHNTLQGLLVRLGNWLTW